MRGSASGTAPCARRPCRSLSTMEDDALGLELHDDLGIAWAPCVRETRIEHPAAEEGPAVVGPRLVDPAALADLAVLAPGLLQGLFRPRPLTGACSTPCSPRTSGRARAGGIASGRGVRSVIASFLARLENPAEALLPPRPVAGCRKQQSSREDRMIRTGVGLLALAAAIGAGAAEAQVACESLKGFIAARCEDHRRRPQPRRPRRSASSMA